jgi:hypothetical protein
VVFREAKPYTAPNPADEEILNEHFYRDVIEEPKPTANSQPVMIVPNVKQKRHWTTIHLRIL